MRFARGGLMLFASASGLAAAALVHQLVRTSAPPSPPARAEMVEILVAARAISVGETVGKDQVRWQSWPRDAVPAGSWRRDRNAAASALPVAAAPARFALLEGEPLAPAKLAGADSGSPMALLLAPGMRAVSAPIREETSAGGLIQPGDRVDVIVIRKRTDGGRDAPRGETLLRGVRVLAMGKTTAGKASASKTATLELLPAQARSLAAAQSGGEISLSLIGAGDLARGDFAAVPANEIAAEIRVMKFGRATNRQSVQ